MAAAPMMDVILTDESSAETARFSFRHEHDHLARLLGLYEPLWFCPEQGIESAGQLIAPLEAALLKTDVEGNSIPELELIRAVPGHRAFIWWMIALLKHCRSRPGDRVRSAL